MAARAVEVSADRLGRWKRFPDFDRLRDGRAGEGRGGFVRMSDGVRLFYQAWTPGAVPVRAVLCCLHGMVSHGQMAALLADALTPGGVAVYAPDHRGHGLSEGPRADIVFVRRAMADIREFIGFAAEKHPGIPLFLHGESMGGLFAANYAARRPGDLAGLILIAPAIGTNLSFGPADLVRMPCYFLSALADSRVPVIDTTSNKGRVFLRNRAAFECDAADPYKTRFFPPHLLFMLNGMIAYAKGKACDKIEMPVLVFQGDKDYAISAEATYDFFDRLAAPDKTLRRYRNAAHALVWDPVGADLLETLEAWLHDRA